MFRSVFANNSVYNLPFMKVSTENDKNFGYEKNYDFGRQYAFNLNPNSNPNPSGVKHQNSNSNSTNIKEWENA